MARRLLVVVAVAVLLVWSVGALAYTNRGTGSDTATYTELVGGAGTWFGVYDSPNGWGSETETGDTAAMTVQADVELWCSCTWEHTGIYFHQANASNPPPAVLGFTFEGNHGEWMGIAPDKGTGSGYADITKLVQTKDYRGNAKSGGEIDLTWEGREYVSGAWNAWREADAKDTPGADNTIPWAYWWLIDNGNAGYYPYQVRCTPHFDQYQADGSYELDPVICVSPEL